VSISGGSSLMHLPNRPPTLLFSIVSPEFVVVSPKFVVPNRPPTLLFSIVSPEFEEFIERI
jgi:hypothetical protein